jgi:hypothetical protein
MRLASESDHATTTDTTMLTKTRIALSAAIALGAASQASAATKIHIAHAKRPAIHIMVRNYNTSRDPSPPLLEAPDPFGIQSQR